MNEWIKILTEDDLPEPGRYVLAWDRDLCPPQPIVVYIGNIINEGKSWMISPTLAISELVGDSITHWQPLPEPPKGIHEKA